AAQQAASGVLYRRVCGLRAGAVHQRALGDRIKIGILASETCEVNTIAKLTAKNWAIEHIIVVDHRMDDGDLALCVRVREAEIVDRASIKIAAVAFAGKIKLRNSFAGGVRKRIDYAISGETRVVVLQECSVGQHCSVPPPHPVVVE